MLSKHSKETNYSLVNKIHDRAVATDPLAGHSPFFFRVCSRCLPLRENQAGSGPASQVMKDTLVSGCSQTHAPPSRTFICKGLFFSNFIHFEGFFWFSFRKGAINTEALYCFIGFSSKRKTTPNSVTPHMTFLLKFFRLELFSAAGSFLYLASGVPCSSNPSSSLMAV